MTPPTIPPAPVYNIEFCNAEIVRFVVDAIPVESDVVVAPVAVMVVNVLEPENVLFL